MSRPRPRRGLLLALALVLIVLLLLAVGALAVRTPQPRVASIEVMEQAAPTNYQLAASTTPPAPTPPARTPIEQPPAEVTGTPAPYQFVADDDVLWRQWKSGKRDGPYCPSCYHDHRGYEQMHFTANVSNSHGGLDEQWTCDHCSFSRTLPKTLLAKARP